VQFTNALDPNLQEEFEDTNGATRNT